MSLAERLKKIDTHSSVAKEFRVHTIQGAAISLATVIAILYLTYAEFVFNFTTTVLERVHVNATTPRGVELEFDVTLHSVACALLSVDAEDTEGQRQSLHLDKTHHIWKHRLSNEGELIGHRSRLELGSTLKTMDDLKEVARKAGMSEDSGDSEEQEQACGSCYGAGEEGECCNTCDDVKRAYTHKGWVLQDISNIRQCRKQVSSKVEEGEGCNVHGVIALSTGGGDLHFAPGHELENMGTSGGAMFDFFTLTFEQFNVSHTINKLRFGEEYPGHVHQLDGETRIIEPYGMYQYYISVVPTLYRFLNGTTIQTNQYSVVTEHTRRVHPGADRGLPGVFFFYEVSALHVQIEEYRRGWIHFFTSVCAIVGGVVTVMGMLDQYIYSVTGSSKGLVL